MANAMAVVHKEGYNERLFRPGSLRRTLHLARFKWTSKHLADLPERGYDMIEIGCFDGRVLEHCPAPRVYRGFDANWEGGLSEAIEAYAQEPEWAFVESSRPEDLASLPDGRFDVGVSLETMEHIEPDLVEAYVAELRRLVTGRVLITVPNEIGVVFAMKRTSKQALRLPVQEYSRKEWFDTVLGRADRVARDGHKGFDYRWLVQLIGRHFEVKSVESVTNGHLPLWAAVTVGIVAETRSFSASTSDSGRGDPQAAGIKGY